MPEPLSPLQEKAVALAYRRARSHQRKWIWAAIGNFALLVAVVTDFFSVHTLPRWADLVGAPVFALVLLLALFELFNEAGRARRRILKSMT